MWSGSVHLQLPEMGERIYMSLIGEIPQSDQYYPMEVFHAFKQAKVWLDEIEEEVSLKGAVTGLFRTLEDMRFHSPFRPSGRSDQEPMVFGGQLEYREPVWSLIHKECAPLAPYLDMDQEQCALWMQSLVGKTHQYFQLRRTIISCNAAIKFELI